jgi:hypothetical protein
MKYKLLLTACRNGRGRSRRFVPRLPGAGFYTWGYDTELFDFLVRTSRHDNDRIERGLQGRGSRAPASRRGVVSEHSVTSNSPLF